MELIDFDAEKANELLDVVFRTKDTPVFLALNKAASINLAAMAKDLEEQLEKRAKEALAKAEEEDRKAQKAKADLAARTQAEQGRAA